MSKQPFLLFKYSDVSVPEINFQFILSKKKKKKRMQKKTAAFSSFSAWTAVFSRVNEWFKKKFSSRHNMLWFVPSGISLKSINWTEGLAFTCNVQKMWDTSDYIMNEGDLFRTKLAKRQDCFFTKHLCLFRICFQSKWILFSQKKNFQWTKNSENRLFKKQKDWLWLPSVQFSCLISLYLLR